MAGMRDINFENRLLSHMINRRDDEAKSMLNDKSASKYCDFGALLQRAAQWNNAVIARELIHLGADVNYVGRDGKNSMKLTILCLSTETIKVLLEAGASVQMANAGENSLQMILRYIDDVNGPLLYPSTKRFEIVEAFFQGMNNQMNSTEALADNLLKSKSSLFYAIFFDNVKVLECILNHGVDINSQGAWQMTALYGTVALGKLQLAKWLLERGVDVDALAKYGRSPLFVATLNCNKALMKLLLDRGANPNAHDTYYQCGPLLLLFGRAQPENEETFDECVEILLHHGATPQNSPFSPSTIFDYAVCENRTKGIHCLIARLAILEMLGASITESVMFCREPAYQSKNLEFKNFHERCTRVLAIDVFEKLTLLDLFYESETSMKRLVRKETFASDVEKFCSVNELYELFFYYYKLLMKRIDKANSSVKLEDNGIVAVCKLLKGNYNLCYYPAKEIVSYLSEQELEQLCLVYQ